jgi:hypothetical protein
MNENVGLRAPAFDGPVTLGFELRNCRRITGVLVRVDDPRRPMVLSAQGFGVRALSRCWVAFSRQKEVDRRTAGVESPYKYAHLPFTRM